MTHRRAALALPLALALLGCDPERRVLGRWEVVTIDGVGAGVAAASRVPFPPGIYGNDTLAADFMWHEVQVDSLVLAVLSDGTFRERLVERQRMLVQKNTYVRPDYVSPAFGGDLIRDELTPSVEEVTGSWTLTGDSLVLTQPRDQTVGAIAARVASALPSVPEAAVREAVDRALPPEPGPRWTGRVRGELLELRDHAGRALTFRRVGDAP